MAWLGSERTGTVPIGLPAPSRMPLWNLTVSSYMCTGAEWILVVLCSQSGRSFWKRITLGSWKQLKSQSPLWTRESSVSTVRRAGMKQERMGSMLSLNFIQNFESLLVMLPAVIQKYFKLPSDPSTCIQRKKVKKLIYLWSLCSSSATRESQIPGCMSSARKIAFLSSSAASGLPLHISHFSFSWKTC